MLITLPRRQLGIVVVGGNLAALSYSFNAGLPIIINKIFKPHPFQKVEQESALEQWHMLYYSLSNSGLNLLGANTQKIRIREEELSVTTQNARVIKFDYKKAVIFDDENVLGLPSPKEKNKNFIVLDWMIAKSCQMHTYDCLKSKDGFVSEIQFYPSERIDGNHTTKKDLVAISHLSASQLEKFEYSDTYAKFKAADMMKRAGIGGRKCGNKNQYALKLEVSKREIIKAAMHSYDDTQKLEFK